MAHTTGIKKASALLGLAFLLAFSLVPAISWADPSPDNAKKENLNRLIYECGTGDTAGNCNFDDMIAASKQFVNWGTTFALEFTVAIIAYIGYNYMISVDNPKAKSEAKAMLIKTLLGIAWILGAWLVVTLIANALLGDPILGSVSNIAGS